MRNFIAFAAISLSIFFAMGCSSTKLTQQYKNPDTDNFQANKVLVVGITADKDLRRTYEKTVMEALENKEVIAVKSIDFFENSFTNNKKSVAQLSSIETQLMDAGFDAVLFTKIIGKESKMSVVVSYRNFAKNYQTFESYYYGNQHLYFKQEQERYQVYTTETSLYCLCPGKERELIWRGEIEVVDANRVNQNINGYINKLFKTLKENSLLLID